ncbi:hypothetical protein FOA52_014094 [Chlamydomonas sp. UWO 241]|nr:hypothetical protein FOA52_014094 [Chlamydomonas sp. UWO 241]
MDSTVQEAVCGAGDDPGAPCVSGIELELMVAQAGGGAGGAEQATVAAAHGAWGEPSTTGLDEPAAEPLGSVAAYGGAPAGGPASVGGVGSGVGGSAGGSTVACIGPDCAWATVSEYCLQSGACGQAESAAFTVSGLSLTMRSASQAFPGTPSYSGNLAHLRSLDVRCTEPIPTFGAHVLRQVMLLCTPATDTTVETQPQPQLTRLALTGCALTGELPVGMLSTAAMRQLVELDLSGNLLSGQLPAVWASGAAAGAGPPLLVNLSGNMLTGPLPANIQQWLPAAGGFLDLSNNQLTGPVPPYWLEAACPSAPQSSVAAAGAPSARTPPPPQAVLDRAGMPQQRPLVLLHGNPGLSSPSGAPVHTPPSSRVGAGSSGGGGDTGGGRERAAAAAAAWCGAVAAADAGKRWWFWLLIAGVGGCVAAAAALLGVCCMLRRARREAPLAQQATPAVAH